MKRHNWGLAVAIFALGIAMMTGCGESGDSQPQTPSAGVAAPPLAPAPMVLPPKAASNLPAETPVPSDADEHTQSVVAEVGFGKKGHYDSNDYVSTVVSAGFRIEERLALARITDSMQKYKAKHDDYPKTHDIFWEKIIKANGIKLPELRSGEKYLYDPELAQETSAEQSLRLLKPKS